MKEEKLKLMFILFACTLSSVQAQIYDKHILRVKESTSNFAFCLDNPLAGIPATNWGVYDFWYQLNIGSINNGDNQEIINFMPTGSHPDFKITSERRNFKCKQYYWDSLWNDWDWNWGTCSETETKIRDGGTTKYKFQGGYDWYLMSIAYQESVRKAQFKLFHWVESNFTFNQNQPHFPTTCFMKTNLNSGSTYNRVKEIKFWSVPAADYDSNFYERYYGRTFKYYSPFSPWLLGSYVSQPEGTADVWNNQVNTAQGITTMQASAIKWEDEGTDWFKSCQPGYRYVWFDNNNCIQCTYPCDECSWQNQTRCITCAYGFFALNYQCLPVDCPRGQFFNYTLKACTNCISPCSSCLNETACTYCLPGFNYIDNFSYQCEANTTACPAGTFLDTEGYPICRSCPKGCQTCTDENTCTTCLQNLFLEYGQCVTTCGLYQYANLATNQCVTCAQSNCEICKTSECTLCLPGFYYNGAACVSSCATGRYPNDDSRSCMLCQPDCAACHTNNYTCTSCNTGTFLLGTSCVKKCPYVGYYQNAATKTCDVCAAGCKICVASTIDCISCLPTALYSNRKCLTSCPPEYFTSVDGNCYPCDPACKNCTGSLNSECSFCNTGNYLLGTTCDTTCPAPYYANTTLLTCKECKYYCNGCTTRDNCYDCKPGYPALPGSNCSGGYYLKTTSSFNLQLPINTTLVSATYEPEAITVEVWFKSDDITSINSEIIVGMSPYKIRKRSGQSIIQIYFQNLLTYCDSGILLSNVWYNFGFAIKEPTTLTCFLNGIQISTGSNPIVLITQNVTKSTELTLGGTQFPGVGETNFVGRLKEFRWWKNARSNFDMIGFRQIRLPSSLPNLIAYWRFEEINDGAITVFTDSAGAATLTHNPTTGTPSTSVQDAMDFRELYLRICPQGQYNFYDQSLGYQVCLNCNPLCKNCLGPNTNDCVECYSPFRLIQEEKTCIDLEFCPDGFYEDPETGLCFRCFEFCDLCVNSATMCNKCKAGYFREYQGTSCVDECPLGMYGNYAKKLCYTRPAVDYVLPDNGVIINYGDFIDATADYTVYNSEPRNTYSYGWKIVRLDGSIDISEDVVKPYFETDILRVHFDNNVLQPNYDYNVTFFVKGSDDYYKGMYAEQTNKIYLGIQPKNGKCQATPLYGIANVTNFNFNQSGWQDKELITKYEFFYSMDGGNIYIPLESTNFSLTTFSYTFQHIYSSMPAVRIKCKATNIKGFSNQAVTLIALEPRSNADASMDLEKMSLLTPTTEPECLKMVHQLKLISQSIGYLKDQDSYIFDPKIQASECNSKLCYDKGKCIFQPFTKKYYCNCSAGFAGQNCTFSNETQLELIKIYTQQISITYNTILNKLYEFEFLKLTTTFKEHLNDISYAQAVSLMRSKIQQWNALPQSEDDLQNYLIIISNLIEYVEFDILENNNTQSWNNSALKIQTVKENIDYALELFESVRLNSLSQISMLNTQIQLTSRMLAFRHVLISQTSVVVVDASNTTRRNQKTMIKIAETNFLNQTLPLEQEFITEAIEYALNPYQLLNIENISNNVFEVNFYNSSTKAKVSVSGLQNGFEISFPLQDNFNLTNFVTEYNSLSPYKAAQLLKRDRMLLNSKIACRYWNGLTWDTTGFLLL